MPNAGRHVPKYSIFIAQTVHIVTMIDPVYLTVNAIGMKLLDSLHVYM
jgi:hypothetical protein